MLAVLFSQDEGIKQLFIEGDALQVLKNVNKPATDWNQGGLLIEDARNMSNSFVLWSVGQLTRLLINISDPKVLGYILYPKNVNSITVITKIFAVQNPTYCEAQTQPI